MSKHHRPKDINIRTITNKRREGAYGRGVVVLRVVNNAIGCNNTGEISGAAADGSVVGSRFLSDFLDTELIHIDETGSYDTAVEVDRRQVTFRRALPVMKLSTEHGRSVAYSYAVEPMHVTIPSWTRTLTLPNVPPRTTMLVLSSNV